MADKGNNFNGIINIYKEAGFTSFDVVAKMRGICGQKKIGHTGTLDPDATGVLPVCLGNATKVCELLTDHDKEYTAELLLGVRTDTQDVTGKAIGGIFGAKYSDSDRVGDMVIGNASDASNVISADVWNSLDVNEECIAFLPDEDSIRDTIGEFVGEIEQVPPMYSALKVNGQKLCDLARKGVEVERKARKITVFAIEVIDIKLPVVKMRVHCSKGTYIRTLCDDIGEKLGCGGTMLSLVRSKVGPFDLGNAVTLAELQSIKDEGHIGEKVIAVDSLFMDKRAVTVTDAAMKLLLNGNVMYASSFTERIEGPKDNELFRVYKSDGTFAGMYFYCEMHRLFKPEKMFL